MRRVLPHRGGWLDQFLGVAQESPHPMPRISIADSDLTFDCAYDETLLAGGLRAGLGLPYECNAGGCGSCKMRVHEGKTRTLWEGSPVWTDADRRRGRVLGCQAVPLTDCTIGVREVAANRPLLRPQRRAATLQSVTTLTHDMSEFVFITEGSAAFLPGQYAALVLPTGCRRIYSMSNLANDQGHWHFIIRAVAGGAASAQLFSSDTIGQQFVLDGPYGLAHIRDTGRDIVCVAGGSGLAPILSIIRSALSDPRFADRRIILLNGARAVRDLVSDRTFTTLPGFEQRVSYHAILSDPGTDDAWTGRRGLVHETLSDAVGARWSEYEYYFAGPTKMTEAVYRTLTEYAHVPPERLHFDRFY
jgi:toluene monooxygenase electron transfer component